MNKIFFVLTLGISGSSLALDMASSTTMKSYQCVASGFVCAGDCEFQTKINTVSIIKAADAANAVSSLFASVAYQEYLDVPSKINTSNLDVTCTEH